MTSVEQIVLSGIRSFNPDTSARQGIRFQKPVTIILGPNGSGKTTVIEALRNACTGEVPGKGASFIHDPKIAGETEVKAQIKLQFRTAANQQMLVGRSYQLTQGVGNKQKFETLDVSLQTRDPKNGQVVSQSYKCSDIDKLIPELLGISKAILDNVVFLHQDDTNWPLQEAAKLKKKFDDIFSSTRYTKALEELRKVVKDTKDRIKEHQLNLAVFKEKRAAAHQLRQQVEETQQTIEASAEHIKSIDKKIEGVVRRLEETCRESDGIQQLENDAMKLQGTVDALVQQREAMHSALHAVSEETDEELTGALAQFANLVQELKQVLAQTESKLRSFQNDHRSDDSAIFSLKSQRELLIAQSNEHQRRVQQLQSVIRETATSFSIPLPSVGDARIDENELLQFFEAFSSRIEALKQKRQAARTEARRAQEDTEKQVSDVRMKRDHVVMMQQGIDQRTEALRPKLRELKDRFNVLSTAEKDYEDASSRCKELEDARKTKLDEEARTNERLQALREQHEGFRVKADALREEAASRQEEQEAAHKLRMLRDERNRISSEVATRKSQLEGRFTDLVGRKVHGNVCRFLYFCSAS
ncbi:DNA repair protein RAD50 [Diplonema papillatum]|nr:DNA repair protein RAD50 [Diplonema papillatum]